MKLKILTYNIRGLPWIQCPIDSILFWSFLKSEPDFICLQEVFTSSLKKKVLQTCHQFGYDAYFPEVPFTCCQRFSRFQNPSGLCTLVKREYTLLNEPVFEPFLGNSGVDTFVTKGFFLVEVQNNHRKLQIVNTHFQSDFTEFSSFRINYPSTRETQENQLYIFTRNLSCPIICGDFNKEHFSHFDKFDEHFHITFPGTGEQLDHMLLCEKTKHIFKKRKTTYYDDLHLSDHIPILFEFEL